mmetsp:Transcript_8596/g.17064  ORF Transcript_8596/g.17064 Transcript_8596/m.17064 type:complete len:502 (-) Transcript_8596:79-1584(-)
MSAHPIDISSLETRLFINNQFVESDKQFPTVNPATEEVICQVHEANEDHVDQAVQAAKAAFHRNAPWRTMNASARRDLILKLADLMERDHDYLVKLESLDNGKPTGMGSGGYGAIVDIALAIKCFRYYAGWADKMMGKQVPIDGDGETPFLNFTYHEPVGVVGCIIPWNFATLMATWKLAPALACGCTLVIKTSEKTPLTGLYLGKLIKEAGFPDGVVNFVSGFGPTAGKALALHPDVNKVAFTGSTATGKIIQKMAAESIKRVTLELGGKSPLIITKNANLDQAVSAAHTGLFLNQGQCCIASSRIYVHEDVHDAFVEKAVAFAEKMKTGGQFEEGVTHGPQVDEIQFQRVMGYIQTGKDEGCKVATGGDRHGDKGYFVKPTIFIDVEDHHTIAQEEIFGPVMSVLKFKSLDEVIDRANNSIYGLGAGIISRDIGECMYMAKHLQAGTVYVNCYDKFDAASAFGGFKQSGIGRELGEYALHNFTEVKTVTMPIDLPPGSI